MGGGNEADNLIYLTAEEHFTAHLLLIKIHPEIKKLVHAANWMRKRAKGNKEYGWLRRRHAIEVGNIHRGKKLSEQYREKISVSKRGKSFSLETRCKMSAAHFGKLLSPETRAKLSVLMLGKKMSAESVAKMAATKRGNKYRLGAKLSKETKAKISASHLARHARLHSSHVDIKRELVVESESSG
jgi:hypothetical protein